MKTILISAIMLISVSSKMLSADTETGLAAFIHLVKERNTQIKAARSRWQSKVSMIIPSRTLPDLNIGMTWDLIPGGGSSLSSAGRRMLTISQAYPFFGKISMKGRISKSDSDIYMDLYKKTEWMVITRLKKAYYRYYYLQKIMDIYREEEELLNHYSKVAEQSYRVGREKQINVLKAQVELAKIMDVRITMEKNLVTVQAEINTLLDYPCDKSVGKLAEPEKNEIRFAREDIKEFVLRNNPELNAVYNRSQKAFREESLTKKSYLPDFMFIYRNRFMPSGQDYWDIGGSLNLPLYFWKQKGKIKSMKENSKNREYEYSSLSNEIRYRLTKILTQIDIHSRLYKLYETNFIPKAEQAKEVAEIGYKSGTLMFLDLLDTERSYLELKIGFWEHLTEYFKSVADLEEIAGADVNDIVNEEQ